MTTILERPSAATGARRGADVALRDAVPWVVRDAIAPRVWREGESCWLESNGSEGCYGGWELRFPVEAAAGDELHFELHADAHDIARGVDALLAEAFWHDAGGALCDWDPVFFAGGNPRPSYAVRLRCPAGATELRVRCGLRWSPTGRVRWHGWRLYPVAKAPPRLLRLGVASARPERWVDRWANRDHYLAQCHRAGEAGLGLVCLPELILTMGMPHKGPQDVVDAALPVPGAWLEPFRDVARRHRLGICFSAYERAGERGEIVYNTAVLLGQDGELIGTYRKVHLALAEARNGVAAGHELPVHDFHGVGVGMLICMDSAPLEGSRILARKGAEVMLMPIAGDFRASAWLPRDERGHSWDAERWKLVQRAHAFDNHLYTAVARNHSAGSSVTAPWGEFLAYDDGTRGLVWADVDLNDRRRHPAGSTMQAVLWSMRRPGVYDSLSDTALPAGVQGSRG
jgi:predicted amidohydrolase